MRTSGREAIQSDKPQSQFQTFTESRKVFKSNPIDGGRWQLHGVDKVHNLWFTPSVAPHSPQVYPQLVTVTVFDNPGNRVNTPVGILKSLCSISNIQ